MEFCPKCGRRLLPNKKGKKNILVLRCPKCGFEKKLGGKLERAVLVQRGGKEGIAVIGREEQGLRTLPTIRVECPKCGNMSAYVWQVQTRGADESMTQFFRCTKCGYTFREYS